MEKNTSHALRGLLRRLKWWIIAAGVAPIVGISVREAYCIIADLDS